MTGVNRQDGQVLVMSALVMAFLFLPLSVFVIDTSLVDSSYGQLGETLQASAEDGASSIDVRLHLTGSPSREADYLILYTSSRRGGPLLSLASARVPGEAVTSCSAQ